ncbi:Cytochrome c oxidase subunit 1 [Umbelopsis nana]
MPLKVLTSPLTLVTGFFSKRPKSPKSDRQPSPTASYNGRPSSTTSSVTFTNTVSIAGFSHGKSSSSMSSPCESHFNDSKEMLQYWHNRPLVYMDTPDYCLDDFEFMDTVGTGTFGRVYLAKCSKNDHYHAIKVLKKTEIVRLKQVEHINSERLVLSKVNFPFIVDLYCTFQDANNLYMLQEYVIGGELFSHLRKAGRFTNEMTRFYASEILLAIEYLHAKDMIYRDLKPENLLLDANGHIKITDFGFAKKVDERTWTLCGTPEYLAPEIITSKGHSKAVDWWALGILIFEMLAGYPPFFDDNPFGIYEKILAGKLRFPSHFDPTAKDLVKKLLTADRSKRLGNLKGGADDIKKHKWFRGVDWQGLLNKTVQAPIVPPHQHPGDTSNFEKYADPEPAQSQNGDIDPFRHLFPNF